MSCITKELIEQEKGIARLYYSSSLELYNHSLDVTAICESLGRRLEMCDTRSLCLGAFYHDFGKLFLEPTILYKEGKLTEFEFNYVKSHTRVGARTLRERHYPQIAIHCAMFHHERLDGSGYYHRTELSDYIKILSLADSFSAVRAKRCYSGPVSDMDALTQLEEDQRVKGLFDEKVFDVFANCAISGTLGFCDDFAREATEREQRTASKTTDLCLFG